MNQFVLRLNCYLYGALAITLAFLLLLVYIHGQGNHFPNFSKMIGDKPSFGDDENKNNRPIIRPAELAHLEQDLYVICDDGAVRLRKNFYFKS